METMNSSSPEWSLVTGVGARPIAVASVLWTYSRIFNIKELYLLPSEKTLCHAENLRKVAMLLFGDIEVAIEAVDETDLGAIASKVEDLIRKIKNKGYRVAVDVTAGRKTMSLAFYKAGVLGGADLITYLYLRETYFENVLFPLIPKHLTRLVKLHGRLDY